MFVGINIFWAQLRAHFNPRLMGWAKMSLSWAKTYFMPKNLNSVTIIITLEANADDATAFCRNELSLGGLLE